MTVLTEISRTSSLIAQEVGAARYRAHAKHGENSIEGIEPTSPRWLAILVEEVGEVSHELTYDATGSLRAELVDVVTVATAWIAALDRRATGTDAIGFNVEPGDRVL